MNRVRWPDEIAYIQQKWRKGGNQRRGYSREIQVCKQKVSVSTFSRRSFNLLPFGRRSFSLQMVLFL